MHVLLLAVSLAPDVREPGAPVSHLCGNCGGQLVRESSSQLRCRDCGVLLVEHLEWPSDRTQPGPRDLGPPGEFGDGGAVAPGPSSPPAGGGRVATTRGQDDAESECHALGCHELTPLARFMCRRHWWMLPPELRVSLLEAFKGPTPAERRPEQTMTWKSLAFAAISVVAVREGYWKGSP